MRAAGEFLYAIGFHYWWIVVIVATFLLFHFTRDCRICKRPTTRRQTGYCRRCDEMFGAILGHREE